MGSSSSKYPDCTCLENVEKGRCDGSLNCMSVEGHECICNSGHSYQQYYKYCLAKPEEHFCICIKNGSNNCKALGKVHPCTCLENFKLRSRQNNNLKCKAKNKDHICMCDFNKKICLLKH
jgi:hypothetical protein